MYSPWALGMCNSFWKLEADARQRIEQDRLKKERQCRIRQDAMETANDANTLSVSFDGASDVKTFLQRLSKHLQAQNTKLLLDFNQTVTKTKLAAECISAIANKDAAGITALLQPKDINKFKKFFSHDMYDILFFFQNYPARRQEAIKATSLLPAPLADMVSEYEGLFYGPSP